MSYLMVLPVLSRIHCGIGRFCFCALASFCFVLKVLWDCRISSVSEIGEFVVFETYRHLDCCRRCLLWVWWKLSLAGQIRESESALGAEAARALPRVADITNYLSTPPRNATVLS